MTFKKKDTCFYCDAVFAVSPSAVGDHFPIPQRHGGTESVPCCRECHSLKDRLSLNDWNGPMIAKVIGDFPRLSRETRIFLAKAMCAVQDALADQGSREVGA